MSFTDQFLFFFSLIGAFNGLLISFYLFLFSKGKLKSNIFLALMLFVISIRVGNTMFYHFQFNPKLSKSFLQIALSASLFVGPALYLYIKSLLIEKVPKDWKYHLIPLLLAVTGLGVLLPFEENPLFWRKYLIRVIYYVWFFYILFTAYFLTDLIKKTFTISTKLSYKEKWMLVVWLGSFSIWLAHKTVLYTSYILGGLVFSLIFYGILLNILFYWKKYRFLFNSTIKYSNKKIEEQVAHELLDKVKKIIVSEELFKDTDIKLTTIAKKCNILPHTLSQLLNDNYNKSFSLFVNEFRIDFSKEMLKSNKSYSVEHIGYECGFNSKSNFFSNFKKITGETPASYREKFINS